MACLFLRTIQKHSGLTQNDLHPFGLLRSEVITPRKDHADGLPGVIRQDEGVRDDPPLEIDIRLGMNRDICEIRNFHTMAHPLPDYYLQVQRVLLFDQSVI